MPFPFLAAEFGEGASPTLDQNTRSGVDATADFFSGGLTINRGVDIETLAPWALAAVFLWLVMK